MTDKNDKHSNSASDCSLTFHEHLVLSRYWDRNLLYFEMLRLIERLQGKSITGTIADDRKAYISIINCFHRLCVRHLAHRLYEMQVKDKSASRPALELV